MERTRIVETAGSNRHHVAACARPAEHRRSAIATEISPGRIPTVGCEIKVLRGTLRHLEGCTGNSEYCRIGAPSLTLTIPAVTIHREQRFPFSAIANSTTGAATKKRIGHIDLLCASSEGGYYSASIGFGFAKPSFVRASSSALMSSEAAGACSARSSNRRRISFNSL
jgi:hypothetical protein